jgi:hypothetical protein
MGAEIHPARTAERVSPVKTVQILLIDVVFPDYSRKVWRRVSSGTLALQIVSGLANKATASPLQIFLPGYAG